MLPRLSWSPPASILTCTVLDTPRHVYPPSPLPPRLIPVPWPRDIGLASDNVEGAIDDARR